MTQRAPSYTWKKATALLRMVALLSQTPTQVPFLSRPRAECVWLGAGRLKAGTSRRRASDNYLISGREQIRWI